LLVTATLCVVATQGYPCGWPGRPLHGNVSPVRQLFYAGENATITCDEGYVRFGREQRTCTQDGTWDGLMPFCKQNVAFGGHTQGPPPPLSLSPAAGGEFDARRAVDGDTVTCSRSPPQAAERWWQVRLPRRARIESVGLVMPPGYPLDLSVFIISLDTPEPERADYQHCANFTGVLHQAKRLFHCRSAGQGLVGEYVYIRDDNRSPLDYLTLCEVEVFAFGELRDCGDPEEPAHGRVTRPDADTAAYRCPGGYRLQGRRQRRCSRGEWTGQQPVCRRIFCERPPPLENGFLDETVPSLERYDYNATVRYRCAPGYTMQGGPGVRTCAVSGRWTGDMPRCQPLVCQMPPKHPDTRYKLLNGTTRWQAIVEYSCLEGFTIHPDSGSPLSRCQSSGLWQSVNVTCLPSVPARAAGGAPAEGDETGAASTEHEHHEDGEHEPMSSGVVAGLLVAAVIAILAMILVGIVFTRKRVWQRRKRPATASTTPPISPSDVKTYDQVYEPSYQNVIQGPAPALLSFRVPGTSQRTSRPVEPPYETLKARLQASTDEDPEDPYEPIEAAAGRVYDDVAEEPSSGPYQSLREPCYETLRGRGGGGEEGVYDLVPGGRAEPVSSEYDVPGAAGNYENCRFETAATPSEVPDLLKGASSGQSSADIPPEILALYAKVVKSKKRHRDGVEQQPLPAGADSACPSSPGSSAASSYTRNLIDKFNKLTRTELPSDADVPPPPPSGDERVHYTQICPTDGNIGGGSAVRRPPAEPVVYTTLRPLPPVPPD